MRTIEELKAFCEGYLKAKMLEHDNDVSGVDDWFRWGGYDLNIFGSYWSTRLGDSITALSVDAYPEDWEHTLPDALHTFDVTTTTN